MAVNKVVFDGETKIDLTGDTVTEADVINGKQFHNNAGVIKNGTCTFDSDTTDADALAAEILENKYAYVAKTKVKGTMPNRSTPSGADNGTISTKAGSVSIQQGYHDGTGKVAISATEQNKIIAGNIKNGVTILGVQGSYTGESSEVMQNNKDVTPSLSQQVITPDDGYTCLAQVTVKAVQYTETSNPQGGTTLTILG